MSTQRERTIHAEAEHAGASYQVAVASIATDRQDVIWVESHGQIVAALIPARNYHDPRQCCCKNCPWNGDHDEGYQADGGH